MKPNYLIEREITFQYLKFPIQLEITLPFDQESLGNIICENAF